MDKFNLFFFDIDGVLLPIKGYFSDDIPIHIFNFIKTLQNDPKNKIIISSSWCHDDFDLFRMLRKNNLNIDGKINGDVLFKGDNNQYKEKYISEFIFRDNFLNNREYKNIIIIDDENVSINNIQNILQQEYNLKIDNDIFLKTTPKRNLGIMGQDMKEIFKKIKNIQDTDFSNIKGKIVEIKKEPEDRSLYILLEDDLAENINRFFQEKYKKLQEYYDCNNEDCEKEEIFDYLGYEKPELIEYKFAGKTYKAVVLWYDYDYDRLEASYHYFKDKFL